MKGKLNYLLFPYLATVFALFLYSFTQVDLSLTLSKVSIFQYFQKSFQYIGFYQRFNSAIIFSVILLLLFIFYILFLFLTAKNKLTIKNPMILVSGIFVILVLSYNAFSYDLFNYIFDAKILTFYHQNPFLHKPDDFIGDPMLNFMRWTHRFYPYGLSWLVLTVLLTFIGKNIFLFTFFLFKLLMGFSYLGSCFLIYKISEKIFPENKISNTLFFALNPLVLIEGLVSAHNDFPMVFFTLLSFYLYIQKKKIVSIVTFIFSAGIKYANIVLAPVGLYVFAMDRMNKKIDWEKTFLLLVCFSLIAVVVATLRTTFQPWYFILSITMASFIWKKYYIFVPFILITFFSALIYVPYVLLTDYAKNYPQVILLVEEIGLMFTIISTFIIVIIKKIK